MKKESAMEMPPEIDSEQISLGTLEGQYLDIAKEGIEVAILLSKKKTALDISIQEPVPDYAKDLKPVELDDLSPREAEVLKLVAAGYTNQEIATEFGVTLESARGHVKSLLEKFNVNSRWKLALLARSYRLAEGHLESKVTIDVPADRQDLAVILKISNLSITIAKKLRQLDTIEEPKVDERGIPLINPLSQLTDREFDIFGLISYGESNSAIASRMSISKKTVSGHIYKIFKRLGISDREQVVGLARVHGLTKIALGENLAPAYQDNSEFMQCTRELLRERYDIETLGGPI
ncbi:LuxR C-terminal-related transcriptional regulator [Candidatus Saccharibacteria bacterium]|nr:LuxR C-terminal-related transcriptional regulator [Candidatus Saccharibacteria bacterium]